MQDAIVTVLGGGGFIGRYLVQELFNAGARVRIAQRDPKAAFFLRLGRIGRIQFLAADVRNRASVERAVAGSDAVVNLVGVLGGDFRGIHVDGARNVAEAAKAAGVRALVHLSAIGAAPESPSRYGRSKGEGEAAVRAAFPEATILRPSIVFGREDSFTNRFARMLKYPLVPVVRGETRFQPVFVADLAQAIARAVADPQAHGGMTCDIAGPEPMTMDALLRRLAEWTGRSPHFLSLPDSVVAAMARFGGWAPGAPITWDQWLMLQRDNVPAPGSTGLEAFGITPTPLAAVAPGWLVQYRKQGRFGVVRAVES
ncbi:NAD(P)H-binding protein [Sphingomonas sp. MAH-20]|uniref:NAD(P)H-binding protein n=1 Tax=Sphingomonas horti TaxID=2682842 RepID=A0A6I4J2R8_9SPHN|nr:MULTISPECIES: complex I NDUFA9 subunit family protein [Sphingomonas]MBA2918585.1 complex I NDUFA9 subunit family protein [Sphingomonas sp. CGMCC 1.13658]MVO78616.1 NAD(P)H-binding protein [Sphingomonas horti]